MDSTLLFSSHFFWALQLVCVLFEACRSMCVQAVQRTVWVCGISAETAGRCSSQTVGTDGRSLQKKPCLNSRATHAVLSLPPSQFFWTDTAFSSLALPENESLSLSSQHTPITWILISDVLEERIGVLRSYLQCFKSVTGYMEDCGVSQLIWKRKINPAVIQIQTWLNWTKHQIMTRCDSFIVWRRINIA